MAEDRKEEERDKEEVKKEENYHTINKLEQPGVDNEGRWLKKRGKSTYGYKKHIATDDNGLVLGVHTVAANEHDSKGLSTLIRKVPLKYRKGVMADKGYKSQFNDQFLKESGSKSKIMYKGYKNKPLTQWQTTYNKIVSKSRWVVEHTFGSLKRWFGAGVTRLKGKQKVHTQHIMEAICYNLKRSPVLVCKMAKK